MLDSPVTYPHLIIREDGMPIVERVKFKAIHLIREHVAYGWSAEELVINHPQLRLGEVYSALAYFADHREQVMQLIKSSEGSAAEMAHQDRHQRVAARLRNDGALPTH